MLQVYHHPEYLGHFPCLLFDSDFKIDGTNIHLDCQKLKWIFFRQFLKEMKTIVIGLDKYVEKN